MRVASFAVFFAVTAAPRAGAALGTDLPGADGDEADALVELLHNEGIEDLTGDDAAWELRLLVRDGFVETLTPARQVTDGLSTGEIVDLRRALSRTLASDRLVRRPSHDKGGVAYDIPVAAHPLVDLYIDYFTGRGRWVFARWLERADRYVPMMQPILAKKGVPADTVYLAMIESGFSSAAYSRAAASGFWQFIASTGRAYRLEQDTWVDERRDFVKATESAADYLKALYGEFNDWHLAWAGYNAGSGRIHRALTAYGAGDFWALIENPRSLPKETKGYVPKIIAAAIVAKNRERYGFAPAGTLAPLAYEEVEVHDAVALQEVAQRLGVALDELAALNPALLYQVTPPRRRYLLRVPPGTGAEITGWLADAGSPTHRKGFRQYVVKRGDTLWEIAQRYHSDVVAIKELNGIGSARFLTVGQRLVVPVAAQVDRDPRRSSTPAGASRPKAAPPKPAPEPKPVPEAKAPVRGKSAGTAVAHAAFPAARQRPVAVHVVSPGETLWSISQRYRVTVADLRAWNGRRDNTLGVGETLRIF